MMKKEYDFSKGRRGAVVPSDKQRITIRLDADIIEYFKKAVEDAGGGNYQTAINAALREHIAGEGVVEAVREVVREELKHAA
ncbi:MAG: BrnA antitoxin family protein [Mariprofundaceae bacterium]